MKGFVWRSIDRRELAALLGSAASLSSRAVGETTVYQMNEGEGGMLAIALPGGEAIVVEPTPPAKRRRRLDTVTPASR